MKHKIALMNSHMSTLGGTERVMANLSRNLSQFYDCHIITLWDPEVRTHDVADGVKVFNLYPKKRRLRYMAFDATRRITKYIEEEGIDILVVVGRNCGLLPLLVKLYSSVKVIYCEHCSMTYYQFQEESLREKIHRMVLQQMLYHVPDEVVTLTEKDLAFYRGHPVKSCQIYNALDESLLAGPVSYDEMAKKIITVGRLTESKGFEYLFPVAKKVLTAHPDWSWDVWGDGEEPYKSEVLRQYEESGLAGKLHFKGTSRQIYDLYKDYGIYVMTSRHEGLPMVLLEAKAKKLPLVSFDIHSGPSDIIMDGVNGYLVKPFDVDAMAERICFLIEHPEVRADFSAHAYDNIDKFRKEAVMKQWVDLINDVLKSGGVTLSSKGYGRARELGGAAC